jgi:hypothetical protein
MLYPEFGHDRPILAGFPLYWTTVLDPKLKFKPSSPNVWYVNQSGQKKMMGADMRAAELPAALPQAGFCFLPCPYMC